MRKIFMVTEDLNGNPVEETIFIGGAKEIKALYRALVKHSNRYTPVFCDFPRFKDKKTYGLALMDGGQDDGHLWIYSLSVLLDLMEIYDYQTC